MKPLREWIEKDFRKTIPDVNILTDSDYDVGVSIGMHKATDNMLSELKAREMLCREVDGRAAYWKELFQELLTGKMGHEKRGEFLRALDTSNIGPSCPERFAVNKMTENPKIPYLVWELHYNLELDRGGKTVYEYNERSPFLDKILADSMEDAMAQVREAWAGGEWPDPWPEDPGAPMLSVVGVRFVKVKIHVRLNEPGPRKSDL